MRELKESKRQLDEQMQANADLMIQLTQQQHRNAENSRAPYSEDDSSTSADKPPRSKRCKNEGEQAGVTDRSTRNQDLKEPNLPSSIPTPDLTAMVRQLMKENQGLTNEDWGVSRSHNPFTNTILQAEYPKMFSMPAIPAYEGKTDPRQHVMRYGWMMDSARANDATKCRCFPITLSGIATMWFTRLPPRSISCFDELAMKFIEQFRIHTTRPKDVMSLSSATQAPGELLKAYL